MAAADVPKTAEELRREIEELHRQQREVRAHSTPTPPNPNSRVSHYTHITDSPEFAVPVAAFSPRSSLLKLQQVAPRVFQFLCVFARVRMCVGHGGS